MRCLDEKLPLPRLVYNAVGAGYPVPRNLNYLWNFGVLAGFCLVLQIVTGIDPGDALCGQRRRRLRFDRAHHARRQLGLDAALCARQRRQRRSSW